MIERRGDHTSQLPDKRPKKQINNNTQISDTSKPHLRQPNTPFVKQDGWIFCNKINYENTYLYDIVQATAFFNVVINIVSSNETSLKGRNVQTFSK